MGFTSKYTGEQIDTLLDLVTEGGIMKPQTSAKAVNFRDYDGTILHSYTKEEFLALNELPPLPTQKGLICQEWNWSYEDAKEYVSEYGVLEVGATYITDDGKTRLYIKVEEGRKAFSFKVSIDKANSLVVDWGDGVSEEVSGSNFQTLTHNYEEVGEYVIKFEVTEDATLAFNGSPQAPYTNMLKKIELGYRADIRSSAFEKCYSLSSAVLPNSVTSIGSNAFVNCYSLSSVVIPSGVTSVGNYAFEKCYSLSSAVLPNSVTSIGDYAFRICASLSSVVIPSGVTSVGNETFASCYSLSSAVLPNSVTSIGRSSYSSCPSIALFDFRTNASVPTLANTNAFSSIATDAKIVVPDALYDEWIAATNWSTYASKIVKASEFNA